ALAFRRPEMVANPGLIGMEYAYVKVAVELFHRTVIKVVPSAGPPHMRDPPVFQDGSGSLIQILTQYIAFRKATQLGESRRAIGREGIRSKDGLHPGARTVVQTYHPAFCPIVECTRMGGNGVGTDMWQLAPVSDSHLRVIERSKQRVQRCRILHDGILRQEDIHVRRSPQHSRVACATMVEFRCGNDAYVESVLSGDAHRGVA